MFVLFLVVVFFSRVLRDSMTRYVGRSVGPSVRRSVRVNFFPSRLAFFDVYGRFLRYCSCPPARDFGSRVYGLVDFRAFLLLPTHPRLDRRVYVSGLVFSLPIKAAIVKS